MSHEVSDEFEAIQVVHRALEPLDEEARTRVLAYIGSLLGISATTLRGSVAVEQQDGESQEPALGGTKDLVDFVSLAELYDAASPNSNGEKALVAGFWLQANSDKQTFTAAAANKELAHLGHKIPNITTALDTIRTQKPALVIQTKKNGASRQARKTYKVTAAGEKFLVGLIRG